MGAFRSRHRRSRRSWLIGTTLAAAAVFAVFFVAASGANLTDSTFEGNDGNLVVDTAGNTDWVNAPNPVIGTDQPTGTTDNSFGQGTKEDDTSVTVVTGGVPNSKADLAQFYVASEQVSGPTFLYLGWTRANTAGTTNFDFEVNKLAQPDLTTLGTKTLVRSVGDLLVNYLFQGQGTPQIAIRTWTGSAWSSPVDASAFSEAAINSGGAVANPLPGATNPTPINQFGETAINLTAGGFVPPNACTGFSSAYVKSRSSTSFTSEIKDFIAPVHVNIATCGRITIHKVTENGDSSFGYTTTGLDPATFSLSNGGTQTYPTAPLGSSSVTENLTAAQVTAGWTLKSLTCTAGNGASFSISGSTVNITMTALGTVDCTYTNHINLSPTISTTLSDTSIEVGGTVHDSATLSGATANASGTVTYTVYSDSNCSQGARDAGTVTVSGGVVPDSNSLQFNTAGTFYWQAAYSGDNNNKPATSACTSETLVVTPKQPTISTTLSDTSIEVGGTVHDSATLSGATSDASGTVTYTVYSDSNCSQGARDAGTLTVSGGVVPDSNSLQFNTAGTFYWQAVYSGDNNNKPATSACTSETLVVQKLSPTIATTLSASTITVGDSAHDSATLTGSTSDAGGTVSYTVYTDNACTQNARDAGTKTVTSGSVPDSDPITFNSAGDFFWQAVYSGDANNNGATSACTSEHLVVIGPCSPGYPVTSGTPLQKVAFNESEVLRFAQFDTAKNRIELFYNDEHALALGVSKVTVNGVTTNYTSNTTAYPGTPPAGGLSPVKTGAPYYTPAQLGDDPATVTPLNLAIHQGTKAPAGAPGSSDVSGRPMFPSLFVTDITNNPDDKSGDWQNGGAPFIPDTVYGSWKYFTEAITNTAVTLTGSADPAKNNWSLGSGSDTPNIPGGFTALKNEGYGAEVTWNIGSLGLVAGHAYRLYFMDHDGDQNKAGGDSGQDCINVAIPG
jgi:hypothetical protein